MQLISVVVSLGLLCLPGCSVAHPQPITPNVTAEKAFIELQHKYEHNINQILYSKHHGSCTKKSAGVRRSWDDLNDKEKLQYIDAVKCLNKLPSKVEKSLSPSAKTRADDFTFIHINQTNFVHGSGIFLPWHRQYVWNYERALRQECGHRGSVPYWDWFKYSDDQSKSPVFSSGKTGFGGNGQYIPHGVTNDSLPDVPGPFYIIRAAGTGGGCVTDGAFANMSVNLGPVSPADNPDSDPYGLSLPSHCLRRDFLQSYSTNDLNYPAAIDLFSVEDYEIFRTLIDIRIHPAAHRYTGGDLYDFYSSPSDPVFFLLHSQIDRLWAIWQGQDYEARKNQIGGTVTFLNLPPSANATLETVLKMGDATGGDVTFGHTVSTIENDYCYIYM